MPKTRPARRRRRSFYDYKPIANPVKPNHGDAMDIMFETYDAEWEFVKRVPHRHVWTLIDGEGSKCYAVNGFHFVNRLGYFVTELPWEGDDLIEYRW